MRYRKKPIVVEAEQYFKGKKIDGLEGCWNNDPRTPDSVTILTPYGRANVFEGDWIITGINGEKYPCKSDVFNLSYEPVNDEN